MRKTFAVQVKSTTSRTVANIPEDWTDVVSVALDTKHPWGTVELIDKDAESYETTTSQRLTADIDKFKNEVLTPLQNYFAARGFDVDFDNVDIAITSANIAAVRSGWFNDTKTRTFDFFDETTQYEVLAKSMPIRAKSVTLDKVDNVIVETNAYGSPKQAMHYMLDLWTVCKDAIEREINRAISKRKGGHVRARIAYVGSASVTGSAN